MPVTVIQGQDQAAGHALLGVSGANLSDSAGLQLRIGGIRDGVDQFLDPGKAAAWSPVETWFPVDTATGPDAGLLIELGPAATWHLQPYQPYAISLRFADGHVIEERMSWTAIRLPSTPPPVMAMPEPAPEPEPEPDDPFSDFAELEERPEPEPGPAKPAPRSTPIWVWVLGLLIIWGIVGALIWFFVLAEDKTDEPLAETVPVSEPAPEPQPEPVPEPAAPQVETVPLTVDGARAFLRDQKPDAAAALAEAERFAAADQPAAAFLLYKHAARKGSAEAALQMGRAYDPAHFDAATRIVGRADAQTAADWYEQAARAGNVAAMSRLGEMLQTGEINVPDGPEQAVFWLRKAAEAGDAKAKELLEK